MNHISIGLLDIELGCATHSNSMSSARKWQQVERHSVKFKVPEPIINGSRKMRRLRSRELNSTSAEGPVRFCLLESWLAYQVGSYSSIVLESTEKLHQKALTRKVRQAGKKTT